MAVVTAIVNQTSNSMHEPYVVMLVCFTILLLIINSWTRTHSHAASGAISWPCHWRTSTRRTAVVVGPQALLCFSRYLGVLQVCILYLIVYDFTRFRCAANCTQDYFRWVMVWYCTRTPQKGTRSEEMWMLMQKMNKVDINTGFWLV